MGHRLAIMYQNEIISFWSEGWGVHSLSVSPQLFNWSIILLLWLPGHKYLLQEGQNLIPPIFWLIIYSGILPGASLICTLWSGILHLMHLLNQFMLVAGRRPFSFISMSWSCTLLEYIRIEGFRPSFKTLFLVNSIRPFFSRPSISFILYSDW